MSAEGGAPIGPCDGAPANALAMSAEGGAPIGPCDGAPANARDIASDCGCALCAGDTLGAAGAEPPVVSVLKLGPLLTGDEAGAGDPNVKPGVFNNDVFGLSGFC
jgi:hypothetical protein